MTTTYQILLFVHIIAVTIWFGGALTGIVIGAQIRKNGAGGAFGEFCKAFAQIGGILFGGTSLLTVLSGAGMVALDGGPAFGDTWVIISLVGWFVAMLLGATIVGRSWHNLGLAINKDGATLESVKPLVSKAMMWSWIDLGLRAVLIWVMIAKPGS